MIESNFKYSEQLLNKISKNSTKIANLIGEILMLIILASVAVLFVTGNKLLGGIFVGVFVFFLISLISANKSIKNSNKSLLGHQIHIVFNQDNMTMKATVGDDMLYNMSFEYAAIKKVAVRGDLVYVYFTKKSAIVIPKTSFKTSNDCEKVLNLISNNYVV